MIGAAGVSGVTLTVIVAVVGLFGTFGGAFISSRLSSTSDEDIQIASEEREALRNRQSEINLHFKAIDDALYRIETRLTQIEVTIRFFHPMKGAP